MHLPSNETVTDELWVVLPVKPLGLSKQRLEDCLGPFRRGLTEAMLHDMLEALGSSVTTKGVVIVTMDAEVAALAEAKGATVTEEAGPFGMNPAIEQGLGAARRLGAARLAVLPVDIPLMTGGEFDRLVLDLDSRSAGSANPVMGIVPSGDSQGTNWICIGADAPFKPAYGPGSYRRHFEAARAQGQQPITLVSPRVSLDIDEASDLEAFLRFCQSHAEYQRTSTWQFLRDLQRANAEYPRLHSHKTDESNYAVSKS